MNTNKGGGCEWCECRRDMPFTVADDLLRFGVRVTSGPCLLGFSAIVVVARPLTVAWIGTCT